MMPPLAKIIRLKILAVISLLLFAATPSWGADFDFGKAWNAYLNGDYETALNEWRPLAEQGGALAQHNLGHMYYYGKGVPQNYKATVKWYRLAAEQGLADAQNSLGLMYRKGKGVLQDDKAAVKWLTLAAEQGHASAQFGLGWMYRNGKGVLQDYATAHAWYNIAASNGKEIAAKNRDIIAKSMTTEQLAEAQALARKCIKSNYKNCTP